MPLVFRAPPFLGQIKPNGLVRIDWSHPLTTGLLFYGFDTGAWIIDLVRGTNQTLVGTYDTGGMTAYGSGIAYNNDGSFLFPSDANIDAAGSPVSGAGYSWACAYVQTGTVGSFTRPFGRTAQNGGSQPFLNWDFEINPSAAGQNVAVADFAGSGPSVQTSGQWTGNANNTFTSLAASILNLGPLGTLTFYAQGAQISQSTLSVPVASTTNAGIFFSGASSAGAVSPFIGKVFYGAFWNRVLTAAEVAALHADPYCFLISAEGELPSLAAAAFTLQGFQPMVLM
jgi:hypothetical protein